MTARQTKQRGRSPWVSKNHGDDLESRLNRVVEKSVQKVVEHAKLVLGGNKPDDSKARTGT